MSTPNLNRPPVRKVSFDLASTHVESSSKAPRHRRDIFLNELQDCLNNPILFEIFYNDCVKAQGSGFNETDLSHDEIIAYLLIQAEAYYLDRSDVKSCHELKVKLKQRLECSQLLETRMDELLVRSIQTPGTKSTPSVLFIPHPPQSEAQESSDEEDEKGELKKQDRAFKAKVNRLKARALPKAKKVQFHTHHKPNFKSERFLEELEQCLFEESKFEKTYRSCMAFKFKTKKIAAEKERLTPDEMTDYILSVANNYGIELNDIARTSLLLDSIRQMLTDCPFLNTQKTVDLFQSEALKLAQAVDEPQYALPPQPPESRGTKQTKPAFFQA